MTFIGCLHFLGRTSVVDLVQFHHCLHDEVVVNVNLKEAYALNSYLLRKKFPRYCILYCGTPRQPEPSVVTVTLFNFNDRSLRKAFSDLLSLLR